MLPTDRLHVVTGGPGSGKSTLITALAEAGIATSPEVGRRIIREELAADGTALPWANELGFAERMIVGELDAHAAAVANGETTVLDRGAPDVVGFLQIAGKAIPRHIAEAARHTRYNRMVFLAPYWDAIYAHDAERKQTPAVAAATEAVMRATYAAYGYTLVELPRVPVAERVAFVLDHLVRLP